MSKEVLTCTRVARVNVSETPTAALHRDMSTLAGVKEV